MKSSILSLTNPRIGTPRISLPLLALLLSGNVWAARYQDIDLTAGACNPEPSGKPVSFAAKLNTPPNSLTCEGLSTGCDIATAGASGNVYWTFANDAGNNALAGNSNCTGAAPNLACAGIKVTLPAGTDVLAPSTQKALLSNDSLLGQLGRSYFYLKVTKEDGSAECERHYRVGVTSNGGGWGDPHITTVDGIQYDFQSAGEFVALRGGGIEIQTRQTPLSTTWVPTANAYTGLASCVSIYTAIAARVGKHRISYQQSSADPKHLELRVDGVVTPLGPEGINLEAPATPIRPSPAVEIDKNAGRIVKDGDKIKLDPVDIRVRPHDLASPAKIGGRIVKAAEGDGIEIRYVDGTRVVVTPAWWEGEKKWYLNVDVHDTVASEGIMGRIASGSWLPALADGSNVGAKPASVHDRYMALYEKFADSWRVTNATSLFDYAPGTSTQTFTLKSWPRESPQTCTIENQRALKPVAAAKAKEQCAALVDENAKANCIFDVMATGHIGFARPYLLKQRLQGVVPIKVSIDKGLSRPGEKIIVVAAVERLQDNSMPRGAIQFMVDGKEVGSPVALDATGKAVWNTSDLPKGSHQIVAKFVQAPGFGERPLVSSSTGIVHKVGTAQPIVK